jgi:uncharacterized iron-regulated protein
MLKIRLILIFSFCLSTLFAQEKNKEAYKIFNSKGKEVTYRKMLNDLAKQEMVFFGELHNNPICHWLELEVARDLYAQRGDELLLGAEMFESDGQVIMNEYFLGYISQKNFESEMRLWPNYKTDYSPLVELARENGLRFACTNVPRRYASMVHRDGLEKLEELPEHSQIYIAPLPIRVDLTVGCYEQMLEMGGGNEFFPQAQMIKDATMAYFILNNWTEGDLFLHYNGSFHSDNKEGIIYYIRLKKPEVKVSVITTIEQDNIDKLDREHFGKADYIIAVPSRMTKTY